VFFISSTTGISRRILSAVSTIMIRAGRSLAQDFTGQMASALQYSSRSLEFNTMIYYAPTIFQLAGFSSAAQSILATGGVGLVNVLLTILSVRLLDRTGRRPLLLIGIAGMIASLTALGFVFLLGAHSSALGWLAVGSVMLHVGSGLRACEWSCSRKIIMPFCSM
jgi:MFS family permease